MMREIEVEITRDQAVEILRDTLKMLVAIEGEWGLCRSDDWVAKNKTPDWWKAMALYFDVSLKELLEEE